MLKRIFISAAIVVGSLPASGQSLSDALDQAYQNNPQLQVQRATAKIADEQLAQARAQGRSEVNLSGSIGIESIDSRLSDGNPFNAFQETQLGERPSACLLYTSPSPRDS